MLLIILWKFSPDIQIDNSSNNSSINNNSIISNNTIISNNNSISNESSIYHIDLSVTQSMKQISVESIILEQELRQKNRLTDVITKHFMNIQSLHMETIWLVGDNLNEYPLIAETTGFYSGIFDEYINNEWDDHKVLEIADKLSSMRKRIDIQYK